MKPQWDEPVKKIEAAIKSWETLVPRLQEQLTIPQPPGNLPKESLTKSLVELGSLLEFVNNRDDVDPVLYAIHNPIVQQSVTQVVRAIATLNSNQGPQQVWQLVSAIWSVRTSLVWILPPGLERWMGDIVKDSALAAELAALKTAIGDINKASTNAKTITSDMAKLTEQAKQIVEQLKGSEREASTAKTNSQASAAAAAADQKKLVESLKSLTDGLQTYQELSQNIGKLQTQVESTLEGASKVGLARSFTKRRQELFVTRTLWAMLFAVGIFAMVVTPTWLFDKFFIGSLPPSIPYGWILVIRLTLEAPVIWFTWWAVRQYGYTTRLAEDYAFKEASALSFVGYRKEMGDDKEMLKLLQESAIYNFGSNPIRVLGKSDPSTPAHDLLEKALEKGSIDKAIDLAKAIFGRK